MHTYNIPQGEGPAVVCSWTTPKLEEINQQLEWVAEYRIDADGSVMVDTVMLKWKTIPDCLLTHYSWFETLINKVKDFEHLERHIEQHLYENDFCYRKLCERYDR